MRELRADVPRLRDHGGKVGLGTDGDSGVPEPHPRSEAYEYQGSDEGQRGDRRGGDTLRLPPLFRLSHHAADGDRGVHVEAHAQDRRDVPPGGERDRRDQHGLRLRVHRTPRDDVELQPGHLAQGRGHVVPRGRRPPCAHRQRPARRSRTRRHPAVAVRLLLHDARTRARRLPHHRPRPGDRAGDGGHDAPCLRAGREVQDAGDAARGRHDGTRSIPRRFPRRSPGPPRARR